MGYLVGKFPEEKQVVATSTVEASSIEEGLCALLGVPALNRIGTDGAIQKSGVRMPNCPSSTTNRVSNSGVGGITSESRSSRGSGAMVNNMSAKERLLEETRQALRVSTARAAFSAAGGVGGKARSPASASDSRAGSFTGRAPPPYSSVSSGLFSSSLPSNTGKGGGLMSAAGAQDDDCASTLDLLSPGAITGSGAIRAVTVGGPAASGDGAANGKISNLEQVPENREQQHRDRDEQHGDDQAHQPLGVSPAVKCATTFTTIVTLEELDIPPVLLASLAAEGVTAPTVLQASVWTAGRGGRREDLLVHVSALGGLVCFFIWGGGVELWVPESGVCFILCLSFGSVREGFI